MLNPHNNHRVDQYWTKTSCYTIGVELVHILVYYDINYDTSFTIFLLYIQCNISISCYCIEIYNEMQNHMHNDSNCHHIVPRRYCKAWCTVFPCCHSPEHCHSWNMVQWMQRKSSCDWQLASVTADTTAFAVSRVVGWSDGDCLYITAWCAEFISTFMHLSLRHYLVNFCKQNTIYFSISLPSIPQNNASKDVFYYESSQM